MKASALYGRGFFVVFALKNWFDIPSRTGLPSSS
jgi:hypothetical protein